LGGFERTPFWGARHGAHPNLISSKRAEQTFGDRGGLDLVAPMQVSTMPTHLPPFITRELVPQPQEKIIS